MACVSALVSGCRTWFCKACIAGGYCVACMSFQAPGLLWGLVWYGYPAAVSAPTGARSAASESCCWRRVRACLCDGSSNSCSRVTASGCSTWRSSSACAGSQNARAFLRLASAAARCLRACSRCSRSTSCGSGAPCKHARRLRMLWQRRLKLCSACKDILEHAFFALRLMYRAREHSSHVPVWSMAA